MKHIFKPTVHRCKGAILAVTFVSITVVMILSSCILLMAQGDTSATKLRMTLSENRLKISSIGDDFVAARLSESYEGYSYSTETVENKETFILTSNGTTVLKITVDRSNGNKILLWQTNQDNGAE